MASQTFDFVRYFRETVRAKFVFDLEVCGFRFRLPYRYARMAIEELPTWQSICLPFSFKGKTVLDIGAGCGETAAFFLSHGADKVVAIEPDKNAFEFLKENIEANSLNVWPIRKYFQLTDLSIPHDFLKMDAEGAETLLLDFAGDLGDCVIETHSVGFPRTCLGPILAARFGLRVRLKFGHKEGVWLLST